MKKLLKLIIIGVIAGLTYKFLKEKDVRLGERFRDIKEWISSKAKDIENLAKEDKNSKEKEKSDLESAYEKYSSYLPFSRENPVIEKTESNEDYQYQTPEQPSQISYVADDSEAEEYLIDEKQFPGTGRFPELDQYARQTPKDAEATLESLAAWLIRPASNDLEKARLIFTWIATHVSYDVEGFVTGNCSDTSPEGVLRNRISVCQGYSELYTALCRLAGLEAQTVAGYAKGYGYRPGDRFYHSDHAWNMVRAGGDWKLIDVTWAAGHVKVENGRLVSVMDFDDFWFNTSPYEFIFTHLPEDEIWQLNEPKITLSQYERMASVDKGFFKIGFNGSYCFPAVLNGAIRELPDAYSSDVDLRVVSLPYSGRIPSGKAIRVRIRSDNAAKVAYENNGSITDMKQEGNEFSAVVRTTPGRLQFMAMYTPGEGLYHIFLDYVVE